jgi:LCP family protein required for cell wall assembly
MTAGYEQVKGEPTMKRKLLIGFTGVLLVVFSCVLFGFILVERPLGPSLAMAEAQDKESFVQRAINSLHLYFPMIFGSDDVTQGVCGQTGSMKLLVLGLSSPEDVPPRGADAIRLLKVNYDERATGMLALPPDLWVQTPLISHLGYDETTLTLLYYYAKQAAPEGRYADFVATQTFAQTLANDWEFAAHHYITVDQPEFVVMVDELGGIDITLAEELDGTPEGYGVFPAGDLHLDGQRTLDYVRMLHPVGKTDGEWGRIARQNQVIHALLAKVRQPSNWFRLPNLLNSLQNMLLTDLSMNQLASLYCMIGVVGPDATMLEVTPEMTTIDDEGRMIPDVEQILQLIRQLLDI